MSLSEIKEKLYKKEADPDLGKREESHYDPGSFSSGMKLDEWSEKKESWTEKKFFFNREQNRALVWGAIAFGSFLFLALGAWTFYNSRFYSFSDKRVGISFEGPQDAPSGKLLVYEIVYKNENRASLENAILRVTYPENFRPEESDSFKPESPTSGVFLLGKIPRYSEGKAILAGKAYSPRGALIYLKAELSYRPSTLGSSFVSSNQLGINVSSSSLSLEIEGPQNISSGDEVNYLISYRNIGESGFSNLRIVAEYPSSFSFSESDPRTMEGQNIWYLGNLVPGDSGKIVISGKLSGNRDEVKNIKVMAGSFEAGKFSSFIDETFATKIASSPIAVSQTVNGLASLNVSAGQTLNFEIKYKNEGQIGLRDVIVTCKIDSSVLDYSSLETKGGFFDFSGKTITWKASDYPELKFLNPGGQGAINFSVKVKEVIPVSSQNDKNFVVSSLAKVDSPDVPTPINMNKIIAGNLMDMKVNSKLILDVKGFHFNSPLANFGPIPPQVDQETSYALLWKVKNVSNDVTSAKVEAVLPTNAFFTGKFSPESENLTYNQRNNSLVWDIGNMGSGEGILNSPREVMFQVKIKPALNQVGSSVGLIGKSFFSAKDSFTGENLTSDFDQRDTRLPEDDQIGERYRVAP